VRSALVLDGRFRVFEDGRVFSVVNGIEKPAKVNKTGGGKKYAYVRYMENGKQKGVGVHRLVATAFIPNPENKPAVNHKDGDTLWNAVCNLEWATYKENTQHAYRTAIINPLRGAEPCIYCGFPTKRFGRICGNCEKARVQSICEREDRERRRAERNKKKYETCSEDGLTVMESLFLEKAKSGITVSNIAREYDVSRQWVSYCLKNVLVKNGMAQRTSPNPRP
jgi:hypothetical protein